MWSLLIQTQDHSNQFKNFGPVATIFVSVSKISYNARQNNLAKTANCVFLSRKGDILELPPSPNFNVVLEVFVCECAMTSTLILGEGAGAVIMLEGRRMYQIQLDFLIFAIIFVRHCGYHSNKVYV